MNNLCVHELKVEIELVSIGLENRRIKKRISNVKV